jgi:hypothetical protein
MHVPSAVSNPYERDSADEWKGNDVVPAAAVAAAAVAADASAGKASMVIDGE